MWMWNWSINAPQYLRQFTPHRSPTSRLDEDCGLLHPTTYSFLLSDCLLLDVAPSLSLALAHWTTYGQRHLSTISAQLQKMTKTASVSTSISWPSFINYCFSVWGDCHPPQIFDNFTFMLKPSYATRLIIRRVAVCLCGKVVEANQGLCVGLQCGL